MAKTAMQIAKEMIEGDPTGYWALASDTVPADSYRQAWILYDPAFGVPSSASDMEEWAKANGWRLMKCEHVDPFLPAMEGKESYVGYVKPNAGAMKLGTLRDALNADAVVIAMATVDAAEKATLDALWMSKGASPDVQVKVPVKKIVIGGVALIVAGGIVYKIVKG